MSNSATPIADRVQDIDFSAIDPKTLTDEQRLIIRELLRRRTEEPIRYFQPNAGAQVEFLNLVKQNREVAYFAGNKSGKTYTAGALTNIAALGPKAAQYGWEPFFQDKVVHCWVGSINYKVQREAAQVEVMRFLPKREIKKIHWLQNGVADRIDLLSGSTIGFKTYDQGRESWQGPVKHWIWMDEEPPMDIIKEARSRLTPPGAKLLFTLTPLLGLTAVNDQFIEHPSRQRKYIVGSTYENKAHLDPEYLKAQEELPEDEKLSRLYGQFVRLGGLVYPEFDRATHIIKHFDPDPRKFIFMAGMDFGADHPTAFIIAAIDIDGNIYVFKEYKERNKTFGEHALAWKAMSNGLDIKRIFGDPSAKQALLEFKKKPHHIYVVPGLRNRPIGISLLRTLLKNNKLFISDELIHLIYEFEHHQHRHSEKTDSKDSDVKKVDDDLLDALRYMVATFFRKKAKESANGQRIRQEETKAINW